MVVDTIKNEVPRVLFQRIKSKREREGQRGQDTHKNVSKLGFVLVVTARACTPSTHTLADLLSCLACQNVKGHPIEGVGKNRELDLNRYSSFNSPIAPSLMLPNANSPH